MVTHTTVSIWEAKAGGSLWVLSLARVTEWHLSKEKEFKFLQLLGLFVVIVLFSSLWSPGCPGAHYVHQAGFRLRVPHASCLPSARIKGMTIRPYLYWYWEELFLLEELLLKSSASVVTWNELSKSQEETILHNTVALCCLTLAWMMWTDVCSLQSGPATDPRQSKLVSLLGLLRWTWWPKGHSVTARDTLAVMHKWAVIHKSYI